jgi:predicted amidohydrolase YtcJ
MESERFKTTLTPEFIPVGYDYPGNLSSILARVKKLYTGAQCFSGSDRSLRALLVEDGVIVATGAELTENFDEQEIFNPDHYIIPAFGDGHSHPLFAGRESQGARVTGLFSVEEVVAEVQKFASENPNNEWITGGAYEASIVEGGLFTALSIDQMVLDRPVVLHASDHHTIWVNSKALEIAQVTALTPDPDGGSIARNSDGTPQGTLREPAAIELITRHIPARTISQDVAALDWATKRMLSSGITFVTDSWVEPAMVEAYFQAEQVGALHVDIDLAFLITPQEWQNQLKDLTANRDRFKGKSVTANSVKFLADGALSAGTAYLLEPYSDTSDSHGLKIWEKNELIAAVTSCDKLGFQIHIHAIGDGAVRQALDTFESVGVTNRPVLIHAQMIDSDDLPRIQSLGVICNFQPLWMYLDPMNKKLIEPRIGKLRKSQQYRIRDVIDSGANVSFGSDWPVTSEVPLYGLAVPVHRQEFLDSAPWSADQRITLLESLMAYTLGVAYQFGLEAELGSLEVGKRADFVVLSANPFDVPVHKIKEIEIVAVYKSGLKVI